MRRIQGKVIHVHKEDEHLLFGGSLDKNFPTARFGEGHLTPFKGEKALEKGHAELKKRFPEGRISTRLIYLAIADEESDLIVFQNKRSLIVIGWSRIFNDEPYAYRGMYGRLVSGKPNALPLPCAYLSQNGLDPFRSLREAKYAKAEINRQAQCAALIAHLRWSM